MWNGALHREELLPQLVVALPVPVEAAAELVAARLRLCSFAQAFDHRLHPMESCCDLPSLLRRELCGVLT